MVYVAPIFHKANLRSDVKQGPVPYHYQRRVYAAILATGWVMGYLGLSVPVLSFLPPFLAAILIVLPMFVLRCQVWYWTHKLMPEQLRSPFLATDSRFDALEDTRADTSKWLVFKDATLKAEYSQKKIPMFDFIEAYKKGQVDVKGDLQEALRHRKEWSIIVLTWEYAHFLFTVYIPDVIWHDRAQDNLQVTEHYNGGNDLFNSFLGKTMFYTCGYFLTGKESLEEAQYNKIELVARKLQLKPGMTVLDLGCGWGSWAMYLTKHWGCKVTALSAAKEQVEFNEARAKQNGIEGIEWLCCDYRDMPMRKFDVITCFEMSEHVGIRNYTSFTQMIYDRLDDDGLYYLQIAGLRECWQAADVCWGLFMDKYIFRGADASLPINWVCKQLESTNFEVHSVETCGVHYADTIQHWYKNWQQNKQKMLAAYGLAHFNVYNFFLAWSSIIPEEGRSTLFQIVAHKNLDDFDRRRFYGKFEKPFVELKDVDLSLQKKNK